MRPHGTYSIVALDPDDRRARRRRAVALVLRRLAVHLGAAGRRGGRHAVRRRAGARARRARPARARARTPRAALAGVLAADALAAVRQVGVVDARGGVAVHTGADCIPEAGHAPAALVLPGQHDGPRDGARRDVGRASRPRRATSPSA